MLPRKKSYKSKKTSKETLIDIAMSSCKLQPTSQIIIINYHFNIKILMVMITG